MQIVGLNTELEVAIAHHTTQYKISPCSELNMEQLQIIIVICLLVCLASLWKRHYILSLDCQSTLLLHDSRYDVHPMSRHKSKSW